mmetsp:Transcript_124520/g.346666  ORF Transcript_124520/g.346666 Transcript_124520/m.346666 type:complete len:303 (-) Transcript_124520:1034-1942(-)
MATNGRCPGVPRPPPKATGSSGGVATWSAAGTARALVAVSGTGLGGATWRYRGAGEASDGSCSPPGGGRGCGGAGAGCGSAGCSAAPAASSASGATRRETTSVCHSRVVKCSDPLRMTRITASSTRRSGSSRGSAAWISSSDIRPQRKKSFARSRPVCSMAKTDATASANSRGAGRPSVEPSKWMGTGKSGTLYGRHTSPWQNKRRESSRGSGSPALRPRTAADMGTRRAAKTSLRSAASSSGGQPPSASTPCTKASSSIKLQPGHRRKSSSKTSPPRVAAGVSPSTPNTCCNASSNRRSEF